MAILNTVLGANPSLRATTPQFKPGTSALSDTNETWVYAGPAAGSVAADALCDVTAGTFAITTNTSTGKYKASAAFAKDDYGWVKLATSPL